MIDPNKIMSELFDRGADAYQRRQNERAPAMPDLSDRRIDHLISEEEKADPAKLYALSDEVPDIRMKKSLSLPGLNIYDGTFESPIETPFPENNTVYVKHFKLTGKRGGGPTVVMIHGWRMDDYAYFDWWCWRFALWGLSSVLIDIPYHIRRTPEGSFSGQLMLIPDTDWSLVSLKQCFAEVQLFANWLRARGADPIGTFGVSFGAFMAGLYVCQAENADFAIMGMPPMDVLDTLGKCNLGEELKQLERQGVKTMLTDSCIPPLFNMSLMKPKVPNEKIFVAMGIYDRLVTPECVIETVEKWGGLPWLCKYRTGHINTFALNPKFIRDVRRFVGKEVLG
ncbi:MAG: alpha/beta hydrolase family protein [bacterium]